MYFATSLMDFSPLTSVAALSISFVFLSWHDSFSTMFIICMCTVALIQGVGHLTHWIILPHSPLTISNLFPYVNILHIILAYYLINAVLSA